ncbi:metallophosphoesterase [Bradyrhizobium sp. AS23.2]|uniref:metallophosphoesterase family protein n=1 Tax=Bradyrhizobium sp. AS23.2 TaxID=1680155 RepID=UPI00142F6531|nr:metallophosphoesterase [Bradyrhizobium sp. AS23.2]
MRVLGISDLHFERRGWNEIPVLGESFDVLVCAGDIWEGEPEKAVQRVTQIARGKPTIIVPGNHDFYTSNTGGHTIADVIKLMRGEANRQNVQAGREVVTILSAENPVCEIDDARFVGLTLWADWTQAGRWMWCTDNETQWAARARAAARHPKTAPREYGAIRTERGSWTPYDAVAEHSREKAILLDELVSTHEGPTVVVTHYPPLAACVDEYRGHRLPWWAPAFYASDILLTMPDGIRPDLWICGHVHAPYHVECGRTRVICNPIEGGYFDPNLIIEI